MQFDDFDKKIKEAAEHHHPAYEEKAWDQMEKLLDKHLPVEKDDKRRIIFLLLFLLLGGLGVYLGISKPWQQKKSISNSNVTTPLNEKSDALSTDNDSKEKIVAPADKAILPEAKETIPAEKKSTIDPSTTESNRIASSKKPVTSDSKIQDKKQEVASELAVSNYNTKETNSKTGINKKRIEDKGAATKQKSIKKSDALISGNSNTPDPLIISQTPAKDNNNQKSDNLTTGVTVSPADNDKVTSINFAATTQNNDSISKPNPSDIAKADYEKKTEEATKKQTPKPGKKRKSAFAITFTTGPDISSVGLHDAGKVKLTYGAGLSYTMNRFTIRSGFYVAKKVYTAGPDDYHPPNHYWTYYVDLIKVDADCRVYEIPVTVSYNFSESKTHNWFVSAGLSSYLMKKETYGYYYKDPSTQMPGYKDWTLKNGENHIFSILDLSAGYERKLNKRLSVIAEPYFKIPMDGIGFGSIKLNSAGVLFTLSVKPFVK